jgi:hypothetical protein
MRFIKIVGLAFLASLAVGMVASATASAELGIFECHEESGRGWTLNAECLKFTGPGAGEEHTVKPITGATFTSKASGSTALETGANRVTCTAAQSAGEITSLTENKETIKFTSCTLASIGANCTTNAAGSEIVVPVSSKIVSYLNSANELKAGLLLALRNSGGENKLEISCTGTKVKVYGSVIGAIEPEDTTSLSFTVKFAQTGHVQEIPETNSLRVIFGGGATEKATLEGKVLLDFTLQVEIMG